MSNSLYFNIFNNKNSEKQALCNTITFDFDLHSVRFFEKYNARRGVRTQDGAFPNIKTYVFILKDVKALT